LTLKLNQRAGRFWSPSDLRASVVGLHTGFKTHAMPVDATANLLHKTWNNNIHESDLARVSTGR
jgi:hypothetical protein